MPDVAHDHPSEPEPDGTAGAAFAPSATRHSRRTGIVVGVVGLAGLLGGATYVAVGRSAPGAIEARTNDAGALPPAGSTPGDPSDDPSAAPTAVPRHSGAGPQPKAGHQATGQQAASGQQETTAAPATSGTTRTAAEKVAAARAAGAKDGVPVTRPLTPRADPAAVAAAAAAHVENIGSVKQGSTMRVITAQSDLTGLREQGWVAGGVTAHGLVKCSQTFRFSNQQKATRQPNMMVCWRTSARKSVITVAVDIKGHPSVAKSITAIDQHWRQLG